MNLDAQRALAWQTYQRLPLPSRRDVEWQRFDLRALNLNEIEKRPQSVRVSLNSAPGVTLVPLVDQQPIGRAIPPDEPNKFAALASALWRHGAFLRVPAGHKADRPIEITCEFTGANAVAFPRTLIVLEPGAEATLVQQFTGPGDGVHASLTEVFLEEGARLHYVSFQNLAPGALDFTLKRAHVARNAEIDWVVGMFGGSLTRYDVQCIMDGEGGNSFIYGAGVVDDRQQLAQFTRQHHRVGHTTSDLLFKNVLRDRAATNYAGIIKVEKNANGTNAYQSNRNLVLDKTVQCDTRPILEIESHQLRCTHGATVGRLDENQLYYLRTRGLDDTTARNVLIEAFLDPVLARIQVESVRQEFAEIIHRKVLK
ncbi:MAG: Fe-S cluster assembly protein SufD [Verrucomicrobia bacterium]|nr:Fe-S cluster assembly protein SufD [Verrucomicrobiota bacterium]